MRNTTLESEKEELQGSISALKKQRFLSIIFGIFGVLIMLAANFPDQAEAILSDSSVLSHVVCVALTFLLAKFFS